MVSPSPVVSLALCEGVPVWWFLLQLGIELEALGFSRVFLVFVEMLICVCVNGLRLYTLGLRLGFWVLGWAWVLLCLGGLRAYRRWLVLM